MEDKKWYWENLKIIYNYQNNNQTDFDNNYNYIIVKRKNYIKLLFKDLKTDNGLAYVFRIIDYINYYDLELCGNIEVITNIIKQTLRHIKLKELGI